VRYDGQDLSLLVCERRHCRLLAHHELTAKMSATFSKSAHPKKFHCSPCVALPRSSCEFQRINCMPYLKSPFFIVPTDTAD
jgi:hypothetical protein